MPLFRRDPAPEVSHRTILTINGRPQPTPETAHTIQRRSRLFVECERRLAGDSLTQPAARGHLLGDGNGLEGLVAKIAPLFEREQSLIRWVALRGAFNHMNMTIFSDDPRAKNGAHRSAEELADVVGLLWVDEMGQPFTASSTGKPSLRERVLDPRMPAVLRDGAVALATMVTTFAVSYERLPKMSNKQVNADPLYARLDDVIALDCIAWCAVALLRLDIGQQWITRVPEPDALPEPGWHTDPLTGKFERYWDGTDWTSSCRSPDPKFPAGAFPLR
jgi:hypothetical protein